MNPLRDAIKTSFGRDLSSWVPHIAGVPRLRFELGTDEGTPQDRFHRALDRCLTVLHQSFRGTPTVLVEFAAFIPTSSKAPRRIRSLLGRLGVHPLQGWGVERVPLLGGDWDYTQDPDTGDWLPPLIQELVPDPSRPACDLWRWVAEVNPNSKGVRNLLAFFLSLELAVPAGAVLQVMRGARLSKKDLRPLEVDNLALYDPTSTRLLRPYDDRGADLLARTPEALKGIYDDLTDLILEWDRERIMIELGREHSP